MNRIHIPDELAATQLKHNGDAGRAFITALPARAADFLDRWDLCLDGPSMHGVTALVLPVRRPDDTPAVLKLQLLDDESEGEPTALRHWNGDHAVRLLDHDAATGTMLLERLDHTRMLSHHPDAHEATLVIAGLLAHLTAEPAPPGIRRLDDIAQRMLDQVPWALARTPYGSTRTLVADCAAALREVAPDPGDRLLHWDLHDENVLTADRAPWLAIDPKPLAGDPAFDLWPALNNRFDPDDVVWRFDALTDALSLDRERARAWTLARVLQNALWTIKDGDPLDEQDLELAHRLRQA
ncbi:aminoglycoside phosphotransferase family protein [Streptomyces turgidiscabies]|uniref:Streptomycin 6-kinase n=1 Tax=Streptomyces turgidiscabies (strain Car8) TaxID=698760 RepID=L7F4Y2_STRT8|nr:MULTISPECIES: aminoglycoside phosphotransferase family protein [Streptomyces]ELP66638.1 streptomycin 6-kinase [Streptomyces turgidiscabies Car8]MDX3492943.1 aminoglycoside phosphotransferase family protein [Streptomyces turgidiscabies]GAQ74315.1 aminoglycoside/hydroxyurea antibiotic resistance kinase [Streptomyces turgidiscabies]